jgi:hypothetical protein
MGLLHKLLQMDWSSCCFIKFNTVKWQNNMASCKTEFDKLARMQILNEKTYIVHYYRRHVIEMMNLGAETEGELQSCAHTLHGVRLYASN